MLQLLAADDKRQQLLAQFDAGVKIEVARLTAEAEGSRAEVVKLRNELVRSEAAKAEMSAALLELKDDLGEQVRQCVAAVPFRDPSRANAPCTKH